MASDGEARSLILMVSFCSNFKVGCGNEMQKWGYYYLQHVWGKIWMDDKKIEIFLKMLGLTRSETIACVPSRPYLVSLRTYLLQAKKGTFLDAGDIKGATGDRSYPFRRSFEASIIAVTNNDSPDGCRF